jgi:hypothetical protein
MKGPKGASTEKNLDLWSDRAKENSKLAPRAAETMHLESTGKKMALRDTGTRPYRSRDEDAALKAAKADANHVGSMYMRGVRRDA